MGYFGDTFGRPFDGPLPWQEEPAVEEPEPNADFWATPDESGDQIVGLYRAVWAHSDITIETLGSTDRAWWEDYRNRLDLAAHEAAERDAH